MPFRTRAGERPALDASAENPNVAQASPSVENGLLAPDSVSPGDVRAQLERVLGSEGLRYSGRLSRFLRFVVEQRLAGNANQLKESVLAVEIFDRDPSYDSHVDSIVRVEARRLRDKLDRFYATDGTHDPVIIALPKGSYAPTFALRTCLAAAGSPQESIPARSVWPQVPIRIVGIAALVCVLATVALTRWMGSRAVHLTPPLRRLTSDPGLTFQPALSRDGKLLAYSSDRSGDGNLDIWLQQVSGGAPLRLTDNAADDVDPSFSPDGTIIAYRAEGEVDGIYLVPTLGGKRTLLVRGGYRPRFSPDGSRIAYWTGERTFRTAKIYIVASAGGNPVQFQPEFRYAAYPIWSPDGRHVVFVGSKGEIVREESNTDDWDWWVAPVSGGPAVRTSARKTFEWQRLRPPESSNAHHRIVPDGWTSSGHLIFSARLGNQTNIWRLPVSNKGWRGGDQAEQVTFGAGREDHASMSEDGGLAFSVLTHKSDIWGLPIHPGTAEPSGPMTRLTSGEGNYTGPVVSKTGDRLAFVSDRTGNADLWVKDLKTGRENALTAPRQNEVSPILSPDGFRVAFGYAPPLRQSIMSVPFSGGKTTQLCLDCGEPRAWLPHGDGLLYQRLSAKGDSIIGVLEPSGRTGILLQSRESSLFSPSMSPDGRWLALIVRTPPNDHRITVVPIREGSAAARLEWVSVTEPGPFVNKPRWSPSGNLLYYTSDRDGFVCIWASRLDPATKKPLGDPMPVVHFHTSRNSLDNVYGQELSVAEHELVFSLGERSGNIWLAPGPR